MTKTKQIIEALLVKGCVEVVPSKSSKYRQFTKTEGGCYFVGRSAALRFSKDGTVSRSVSVTSAHLLPKKLDDKKPAE